MEKKQILDELSGCINSVRCALIKCHFDEATETPLGDRHRAAGYALHELTRAAKLIGCLAALVPETTSRTDSQGLVPTPSGSARREA